MRLVQVRIQNYRSIVDSRVVPIEEGVTVVIGKNEQGKTNFLRAIALFNERQQYTPSDLPNHLRPLLAEREPREIPILTLWFSLGGEDRAALAPFIANTESTTQIKCVRYYDNHFEYWLVTEAGEESSLVLAPPDISTQVEEITGAARKLQEQLEAHAQRLPDFAQNKDKIAQITSDLTSADFNNAAQITNVIQTYVAALRGLPGQDQTIQDDIARTAKAIEVRRGVIQSKLQTDPATSLRKLIPYFIMHSARADQIPNEVPVAEFTRDPDGTAKGMANLCRAAGLSMPKLQELSATADTPQREAHEDHYKGTISGGLNEFWTQETYHVHFRIDKDRLSVSISDDTYTYRVPPSDRSEGFQWYLSFYSALLSDMGVSGQAILLLDNPGLELHVDGQRDIKKFLEQRVTANSQVIYVTHSPAMIDPFNLAQLRKVEMRANQEGTKVQKFVPEDGEGFDLLEPVRSAIGMNLAASLVLNEWNVLVEGASDKPILDGAFAAIHPDRHEKILVNGSVSQTKDCFLPRFYERARLPFVVFLDADEGGRRITEELRRCGIREDRLIQLQDVIDRGGRDMALEDILSADFYYRAVAETYPRHNTERLDDPRRKRANLYEEWFKQHHGFRFNKPRVAETARTLLERGQADEDTLQNLKRVTARIIEVLERLAAER